MKSIKKEVKNFSSDFVRGIMTICAFAVSAVKDENKYANRPFISVDFQGTSSKWLVDTGADISCMKISDFRKIPTSMRPTKLAKQSKLLCASGNTLKVKGVYPINLKVLGLSKIQPVYVCENLKENILGIDAIKKFGLTYSGTNHEVSLTPEICSEKLGIKGRLRASSAVTLRPFEIKTVKVTGDLDNGHILGPHISTLIEMGSKEHPNLYSQPGYNEADRAGQFSVLVQNCSTIEAKIMKGDRIGSIEIIDRERIYKFDEDKLLNEITLKEINKNQRLSSQKEKEMLGHLRLNVPDEERQAYQTLILDNADVFSLSKSDFGKAKGYEHKIDLKNNEPIYVPQFKIPEAHRHFLEKQVKEWLNLGIIQRTHSTYNAPLFVVPKKDGSYRIVQDFRALNNNSYDDKYSMRTVDECIAEIGRAGTSIFSTLDIQSAFYQLPLAEESQPLTAFTIPSMMSQFCFLVSSMGLKGCPSSFQRLMETVVQGLERVIVYIDDLLVHSTSHEQHRQDLKALFLRLRQANLKLNLKKCEFGAKEVSYLGFQLTPQGVRPGRDKLKCVRDAPPPTDVKQVRQFLGLCNFFRNHVKNFAKITSPLCKLTNKDSPWKHGPLPANALQAFNELKTILCSEPVIGYPRSDQHYALIVDAATGTPDTPGGLGAIFAQVDKQGNHQVISYASRQLAKHEKNYTPFLLEMTAGVWAMQHFRPYLLGRRFTLFTDHRPLEKLGTVHTKTLNRMQEAMNEFDFGITYKKGSEMPSDYLSRNALAAIEVFDEHLEKQQQLDPFLQALKNALLTQEYPSEPNLASQVRKYADSCFVEDGIVWRRMTNDVGVTKTLLLVPKQYREELIKEAHGTLLTGHDGIFKTKARLMESYFWPNMEKDVSNHIIRCLRCQARKTRDRPEPHLLSPLPLCSEPNQRMHMDLFGPLKTSGKGKKFILCMTDAFTKYIELVALPNKEAGTTARAIFDHWICKYSVPAEIVSDQGKEFINELTKDLFDILKVKHVRTSPAHPQTNSSAEVCNKTIAKYLNSFVDSTTLDWEQYLPAMAFSYNTSVHSSIKATPFFLTFGMEPRLPNLPGPELRRFYGENDAHDIINRLQLARELALKNLMNSVNKFEHYFNMKAKPHQYCVGQKVWVDEKNFLNKNRKLAPNWTGPHEILKVYENNLVQVKFRNRYLNISMDRIKPFFDENSVSEKNSRDKNAGEKHVSKSGQKSLKLDGDLKKCIVNDASHCQQNSARNDFFDAQIFTQAQKETETAPPTETKNDSAPILKRGRGRPRKTPPLNSENQNEVNQEQGFHGFTQEEIAQAVPPRLIDNLPPPTKGTQVVTPPALERRMTRAMARQAERAELPLPQLNAMERRLNESALNALKKENLRNKLEEERIDIVKHKIRLGKAQSGQDLRWKYPVDKYNLPIFPKHQSTPTWVTRRRNFLRRLSTEQRNLLLTGDPAFAFDPITYHTVIFSTEPVADPELAEHFDYLAPQEEEEEFHSLDSDDGDWSDEGPANNEGAASYWLEEPTTEGTTDTEVPPPADTGNTNQPEGEVWAEPAWADTPPPPRDLGARARVLHDALHRYGKRKPTKPAQRDKLKLSDLLPSFPFGSAGAAINPPAMNTRAKSKKATPTTTTTTTSSAMNTRAKSKKATPTTTTTTTSSTRQTKPSPAMRGKGKGKTG